MRTMDPNKYVLVESFINTYKNERGKALLGPRKTKIVDGSGDTLLLFSKDRIYRMHLLKNSA